MCSGLLIYLPDQIIDLPLYRPDRDYTTKYKYFRKMMNNKYTRQLLFMAIKR